MPTFQARVLSAPLSTATLADLTDEVAEECRALREALARRT